MATASPYLARSEGFSLLFAFPWNNYIISNKMKNVKRAFQKSIDNFFTNARAIERGISLKSP